MIALEPENHIAWMQLALGEARRAARKDEVPVGALLVHENEIIGRGHNQRENLGRTCGHAEILALEDFNRQTGQWRLPPKTSLYVTAEPCLMCTGALIWGRLDAIFYGCPDPKNAGLRSLLPRIQAGEFDHRFEVIQGNVRGKECAALLTEFFRQRREDARQEKQWLRQIGETSKSWTGSETQEFPLLPI